MRPLIIALLLAAASSPGANVAIDRNTGADATAAFHFKNVPPPAKDDAATNAKWDLIFGRRDTNGGSLDALHDGRLPMGEDEPQSNFFFRAGSDGGRFRVDLGQAIEISQVNSYSWHADTRAAQFYNLFAAEGTEPGLNLSPDEHTDPPKAGWKLIATVDTRPRSGTPGGQYGVSIADPSGSVGKYRYLLFDCVPTEEDDPFGNTFFSEIDVVEKK